MAKTKRWRYARVRRRTSLVQAQEKEGESPALETARMALVCFAPLWVYWAIELAEFVLAGVAVP